MCAIQNLLVADDLIFVVLEWCDSTRFPYIQICRVLKAWRNTNLNARDDISIVEDGVEVLDGDSSL